MPSAWRGRIRFRRSASGCANSSPPARMATWPGWRPMPTGAAIRARCGPRCARSSCSASITGRDDDPLGDPERARARRHFGLCARRRLSRCDQAAAEEARALADREGRRRHQGVCRYRGRDGEAARRGGRPRLAGQAHQSGVAAIRLMAVPRRDLHDARSAARRAGAGSLRHLPRLPRYLPDGRFPGAVSARCAALHLLSHHRAQGRDPARTAPADRQPHLWLRRLPCGLSVEQIRASPAAR